MKLQASDLPFGKFQTRRKVSKFVLLLSITSVLTVISLYFPYSHKKLLLASFVGHQHRQNYTPLDHLAPKPSRYEKVDTWPLNRCQGGDKAAEDLLREESKNPPPNPKTAPNRTLIRKPDAKENESPKSAPTGTTVANDSKTEENTGQQASDNSHDGSTVKSKASDGKCDLFTGEWVPNPEGPYYTNSTCDAIQEHQNCMKFGRPDTGFMKWRWKPDDCELPVFDPHEFLKLVRGKSLAFVGDSVARNHMQSLICLLSRVAHPVDVAEPRDENRLYQYAEYNFNVSIISSPYLVRTEKTDPNDITRPFNLFLDEFDETWTAKIETFDYVIISAGQWFFRPTYFYLNRTLTGCLYCPEPNVTHFTSSFSYRWAFRTAFRAINGARNFKGVAFLRTFAPSHFEGGPWDKGGDCVRTRPFKRNETNVEDYSLEMHRIQVEEMRIARKAGRRTGGKLRLVDVTKAMSLRPDGHPSKYGQWPVANQTFPKDCVHWCLPGPIDAWNDILQELVRLKSEDYSKSYT